MKSLLKIMLLMCATQWAFADVVVIVHPSNQTSVSKDDLEAIFLGRRSTFADGSRATPFYLVAGDATRDQFDEKVLGRSTSQLRAYWSKLMFTGKGTPPQELSNSAEAVAKVAADSSGVAYVDEASVNSSVKVVFKLP